MTLFSASHAIRLTLLLFLIFLLGLNLVIFGIYQLDWEGPLARGLAGAVGLPAAVVNGRFVPLQDFYERRASAERLQQVDGDGSQVSESEILSGLVREELILQLARENNLTVPRAQLSLHRDYLLRNFDVNGSAEEELRRYDLTSEEFLEAFALPDYLEAIVAIRYLSDGNGRAATMAESVHVELLGGQISFTEAAAKYSDDEESKYLGGEIGFRAQTDLPPWESGIVFDLDINEVGPVAVSPDGFRIFTVTARDEQSDPPRLQVRQIFFADYSFDEFFEDYTSHQSVYVFRKL